MYLRLQSNDETGKDVDSSSKFTASAPEGVRNGFEIDSKGTDLRDSISLHLAPPSTSN